MFGSDSNAGSGWPPPDQQRSKRAAPWGDSNHDDREVAEVFGSPCFRISKQPRTITPPAMFQSPSQTPAQPGLNGSPFVYNHNGFGGGMDVSLIGAALGSPALASCGPRGGDTSTDPSSSPSTFASAAGSPAGPQATAGPFILSTLSSSSSTATLVLPSRTSSPPLSHSSTLLLGPPPPLKWSASAPSSLPTQPTVKGCVCAFIPTSGNIDGGVGPIGAVEAVCAHCERGVCVRCGARCHSCGGIFCSLCSTVSYSGRFDQPICISCSLQVGGEGGSAMDMS